MRINYNVTGPKRKALVAAISKELNAPTNYLGAPTFAYEVGGYHIDKTGVLTGPDNLDLEADLQGLHGFGAVERDYDEPDTYESGLGGMGATPSIEEVSNEAEVWAEREMRRLILDSANVPDYSNRGQYGGDYIPAFEDLPIVQTNNTLRFPWFIGSLDDCDVHAYALLIAKICKAAKEKHRVTAKEREVDNPKYAMRCWLLSLGFIGDEYKQVRKILLKKLEGNSAFKSGAKKSTEVCDDVSE